MQLWKHYIVRAQSQAGLDVDEFGDPPRAQVLTHHICFTELRISIMALKNGVLFPVVFNCQVPVNWRLGILQCGWVAK